MMCGIVGIVGNGNVEVIKKLNGLLSHRGPDDEGYYIDEKIKVYLGHSRLSIIDLESGKQPMLNEDEGVIVIFNGEIYNHNELKSELRNYGHIFKTHHSDTEVLLHGYEEWKEGLLERLNGMFAFAIYDKWNKKIFIARDRFGEKPLYYTYQKDVFAFSSELTPLLLNPYLRLEVSSLSLKKYFAYNFIPSPNSLYKNVYKLPAGWYLEYDILNQKIRKGKYWEFKLEPFEKVPKYPEKEWGEKLRYLINKSVRLRLMSDVPIGIFLSGGIDSSTILYFALQNKPREEIKTFSIGFKEKSFDESNYSYHIADYLKIKNNLKFFSLVEAKDVKDRVLMRLDEPLGDASILPTYLLCSHARQYVKVALGGDGGDELFAGYDPFKALSLAKFYYRFCPKPLHKVLRKVADLLPVSTRNMSFDFKLKRTLRGLSYPMKLWNCVWLGALCPDELKDLFNEPIEIEEVYSEAIESWNECKNDNLIDKTLQFYTKIYLTDDILTKVDRASMMVSLEARSPFLDNELVDFVRKIPWQYKYRCGTTKYILKKSMEGLIPEKILYRPKKGFGIPLTKWLKEEEWQKNLRVPTSFPFNFLFLLKLMDEHRRGISDNRAALWNYLVFKKFESVTKSLRE